MLNQKRKKLHNQQRRTEKNHKKSEFSFAFPMFEGARASEYLKITEIINKHEKK